MAEEFDRHEALFLRLAVSDKLKQTHSAEL